MKLLQQLSATKFKENDVNEVDVESFERPKSTPGLVVFTLTSQEAGVVVGEDEDDRLEASTHSAGSAATPTSASPAPQQRAASTDVSAGLAPPDAAGTASPSKPVQHSSSQEKPAQPVRTSWANRVGSYMVGAARTVATNRSLSSSGGSSGAEIDDGDGGGAYTRTKHFQFKTPEEADAFVECLCLAKALGPALRGAFMALDVDRNGTVDTLEVVRAPA